MRTACCDSGPTALKKISYKYRSGAAALRCLSDGCLYFAPPAVLNDALEARFDLVPETKFAAPIRRAAQLLTSGRDSKGVSSFVETTLKELQSQSPEATGWFQAGVKSAGVFSSGATPDNQPMWAYYCNDRAGVCFELEWSDSVLERNHLYPVSVLYSDKTREHNIAEDFAHTLLEVATENPRWSLKQIAALSLTDSFRAKWRMRTIARATSTKHSNWSHEREIRILSPHALGLPLLADVLKRVYFARTDFAEWSPIVLLLRRLYPSVEVAQLNFIHRAPFVEVRSLTTKLIPLEYSSDPWNLRGEG